MAVFGAGPITLYTGTDYILEAPDSATLRLRRTAAGGFYDWSISHPTACVGNGASGSASMVQSHRLTVAAGDALTGTLCLEGSTAFVTVAPFGGARADLFRCWRLTGNAIGCQKMF